MSWYLISFLAGFAIATFLSIRRAWKSEDAFCETLKAIYWGWGAPDENGHVGWYRDNRNGSPFTDPDSPWSEAGLVGGPAPRPPYAPPPPKPKR